MQSSLSLFYLAVQAILVKLSSQPEPRRFRSQLYKQRKHGLDIHHSQMFLPSKEFRKALATNLFVEAAYKGNWWLVRNLIRLAICSTGNFPVLESTSLRDFEALKMITHKRKEGSSQAYHVI
jgi:hypothetical protein